MTGLTDPTKVDIDLSDEMEVKVTAVACRKDFWTFCQTMWHAAVAEKPVWNWHMRYICRRLQKAAERIFRGETKLGDLVLNVPPGSSKSTIVSVMFPAWCWTRMGSMKFVCCSYSERLAQKLSLKCRDVVRSELYAKCFPEVVIRKDQDTKLYWALEGGGERYAVGSGGAVMGSHAHALLVDDPIDPEQVLSDSELTRINNWIEEQLSGRKVDKLVSITVLVMQRLHECLLPGTPVLTPRGEMPVEQVKTGQKVYGSAGWQSVTATAARGYAGRVAGVRLYGNPDRVWTTKNHLYLTRRGWVRADRLTGDDWVRFPNPRPDRTRPIPWESVLTADPPKRPTGNPNVTGVRLSRMKVEALAKRGMTNSAMARTLGVHRNTVHNAMCVYGIRRVVDRYPIFGREHLDDPDFWRVVGYWVAEGHIQTGRRGQGMGAHFTFGYHEPHLAAEVKEVLGRYEVPVIVRPVTPTNGLPVWVFCRQFASWLARWFGRGAHNKKLPEFVFRLPSASRRQLLAGIVVGDGNAMLYDQTNVTTVSRRLGRGLQRLALSLGMPAFVSGGSAAPKEMYIGDQKLVWSGKVRYVRFGRKMKHPGNAKGRMGKDGLACWYKVRDVETKSYTGLVYDLTTPSRDFVCGNATVHNSDPAANMLRKGWVEHVCIPATTGFKIVPDFLKRYYRKGLMDPIRLPKQALDAIKAGSRGAYVFSGQYGQDPVPPGGSSFKIDRVVRGVPPKTFTSRIRMWDCAGVVGSGDWTVGALMGLDKESRVWVLDIVRVQLDAHRREKLILRTARADGRDVVVGQEQEGGSAGKDAAERRMKKLGTKGFRVKTVKPTGNKEVRADPLAEQMGAGNVWVPLGVSWWDVWVNEFKFFPLSSHDDQVDACSHGFSLLHKSRVRVGAVPRAEDERPEQRD